MAAGGSLEQPGSRLDPEQLSPRSSAPWELHDQLVQSRVCSSHDRQTASLSGYNVWGSLCRDESEIR